MDSGNIPKDNELKKVKTKQILDIFKSIFF